MPASPQEEAEGLLPLHEERSPALTRLAMYEPHGGHPSKDFSNRSRILFRKVPRLRALVLGCIAFLVILFIWNNTGSRSVGSSQTPDDENLDYPPRYVALRKQAKELPQHNTSLPYPEGATGRYVKFTCAIRYLGWNNVLNEFLMNSHLAWRSGRSFVWQEYYWKYEYYSWPPEKVPDDTRMTPIQALLSGPPVGGYWPIGTEGWELDTSHPPSNGSIALYPNAPPKEGRNPYPDPPRLRPSGKLPPRSVSEDYFDLVCPENERRIVYTNEVKPGLELSYVADGRVIFDAWLRVLTDPNWKRMLPGHEEEKPADKGDGWRDDRCVEIRAAPRDEDGFPQVFDLWMWGSFRVLSLWDEFSKSPTASAKDDVGIVVRRGVERNLHLFRPQEETKSDFRVTGDPLGRVFAVHIRRGDYKQACQGLADWSSTFYSWNLSPFLPDRFIVPPYPPDRENGNNSAENVKYYLDHCLPSNEQILKKISDSRHEWELEAGHALDSEHYLDTLFILTNDKDPDYLKGLRETFGKDWRKVVISTEQIVYGDAQEKDVGNAIDMELARRAAVFLGNGWSSFTSNIVHRRLVDGKAPISTRFF